MIAIPRPEYVEFITTYNQHGNYAVPRVSRNRPAAASLLLHRVYEAHTIEVIVEENGDKDRAIVHAGAYFGDFLPALCQGFKYVYALEPVKINFECLLWTRELNRPICDNSTLDMLALSNVAGQRVRMRTGNGSLGGASRIDKDGDYEAWTTTIDDVVDGDDIAVIHLDIEGHEEAALRGAVKTIKRCQPLIVVETRPSPNFLQSIGYTIGETPDSNYVLRSDKNKWNNSLQ